MKTATCTCPDFEPGVARINAPILTAQARNPQLTGTPEFQFKRWEFCPWCGAPLVTPETRDAVEQGLEESARGVSHDLGSFARYAHCSRSACPAPDSCDEYGCRHPNDGPRLVQDEMSTRVLDFDPAERAARIEIAKRLGRDPGGYAAFMVAGKPVSAIQFLSHLTASAPVDAERDPQPVRLSGPVH